MERFIRASLLGFIAVASFAQSSPLLDILSEELNRNFAILSKQGDPAPYFMAYEVTEQETYFVAGTLGAWQSDSRRHARYLDVSIRVGSPKLDNYHRLPGARYGSSAAALLPLEDNAGAIKQRVWLETDRAYRQASQRLIRIRTSTQVKVAEQDTAGDFSPAEPTRYVEAPEPLEFSAEEWKSRVRKWSAAFARFPDILASSVSVFARRETKYLTSTEGTRLQHGTTLARIEISAQAKAADGMDLTLGEALEAKDPAGLAGDKEVLSAVDRTGKNLTALLRAPVAEPFVGPAILSGSAAGVFFHEIFGHRVEGHRQKDESEGQTFTKSVGTAVLPEFLSVFFDPTESSAHGVYLFGHYLYDDEGVQARRVTVVDDGILKTFLMSRSPVLNFDRSNGHGRREPGFDVVSRQSNLIVESTRKVTAERLREMLIAEVRRQNKPYGLYFRKVTGGYTQTGRRGLQAYTVIPILVYRVYPDGRPDELVRGADIVGTPLASFSKILATSDQPEVFNGYCGAESGSIPVSAVSPALLVSEIEIQKKEQSLDRPPLLPSPTSVTGGPR